MAATTDALIMADENPNNDAEAGQVKFNKDSESIDVNAEQKLIGLTKEQLERYRNDPLWKPIRYTLFVLFWLVWIGMFVGAILIVVMSPKCAAKKDKQYYENMVAYQIFTPTFKDSNGDGVGDFNGIKEKLNDLRRNGITTIWPTPLLTTTKDEFSVAEITDSLKLDHRFGDEADLKALIERAHDLNLYFIADLPLTISALSPQATQQGIGGDSKVKLLNLNVQAAYQSLKTTASELIKLGVDGLNFAQYGLTYPTRTVDAQKLDQLATDIRRENEERFYNGADKFVFISDLPVDKTPHSINFYSRSLAQFPNIQPVCTTKDFVDCLKESARTGLNQIRRNASSLPLWQIGDISHARADSLFDNVDNSTIAQANSLVTAMQLFLPGPVKIYYGEELGLPSFNKSGGSQLMQWEETDKGFTDLTDKLFFNSLPPKQAEELNFKAQSDATHSHLKVFKQLAGWRVRDEVFTDGRFDNGKTDGVNVFLRSLEGNDKAYLLVTNWPSNGDKSPRQFTVNKLADLFKLKIGSAEFLVDHPVNEKNDWHIELDTKLTINPYEFGVIRVQVLP